MYVYYYQHRLLYTIIYCPIPADASVNFTSSTYPVNEGDGAVQVCLSLYDIPTEGLECEIEVVLSTTDGVKAGECGCFEQCFKVY